MTPAGPIDLALARRVLEIEAAAIAALVGRLDVQFEKAVRILLECRGRVIVTGMGKSGIICRKIAATLTSTGTPAFFLHPADAVHGDLGVLQADDVVVALSNSGETNELLRVLETIKRIGARLIAITGDAASTLAVAADVALDGHVSKEACPMNLVPTASTTAALALGDALAMTLFVAKGFRQEDFASIHPGGRLGKRLMRLEQVMHVAHARPIVRTATPMPEVMAEMSRKGFGMACVLDDGDRLVGVITDGDLRRRLIAGRQGEGPALVDLSAADVMSQQPVTLARATLAVEALRIMEARKITSIVVVTDDRQVEGVVHLHDLWRTQLF